MKRISLGVLFGVTFAFVSVLLLVNTAQVPGDHAEQEGLVRLLGSKPLLTYATISALAFILLAVWLNREERRGWREVIEIKHSPIMIRRTEYLTRYGRSPSDAHRVAVAKALFSLMSRLNAIGFFVGGSVGVGLVAIVLPRLFTGIIIPGESFKYFLGFGSGALAGFALTGFGSSYWKIGQFWMSAKYASAKSMMPEWAEEQWWMEVARWVENKPDQGYQ